MMSPKTLDAQGVLESRWFEWSALVAAALLVSPTFSMGYLSSSLRKGLFYAILSAAYAFGFYLLFSSQVPVESGTIHDAYQQLSLWTPVVGSLAPFIAGNIFRFAWTRTNPKVCAAGIVAAFGILAFGSSIVTERVDNLAEASNLTAGRAEALSVIAREALKMSEGRNDTPEFWAAQFIATKAANEVLGRQGPSTLDEFMSKTNTGHRIPASTMTKPSL